MSRHILIAALLSLFSFTASAAAAPLYNIVPLGLDDLEHTRNDGYKFSGAFLLNEAGQVIGRSYRYNGGIAQFHGDYPAMSAWLYDGAATIDIGLTGAEHTRNDGYKYSSPYQLNEAGQVSGDSARYNGGSGFLGRSAWLYDGATTIDIGLTGPEHTYVSGYKESVAVQLNEAGQVRGYSRRFNGSSEWGRSAWLYDGATTFDIGLTDAEHTRNDGYKYSDLYGLNEAGQVRGISYRYNGGSIYMGQSAWLYGGATTIDIGLTGAEHTRNDGYKYSSVGPVNEAGQVRGISFRYNGSSTDLGQTSWLYNGATTLDIGLTGPEYTRNDGYKYSVSRGRLNEAGQVIGYSRRYNGGSTDLGQTAWLYGGATTIPIGLTGPEHTRNDGVQASLPFALNQAGQVLGYSDLYNGGSTQLGRSVWLYDGATTIDIGLTGPEHTRNDGYKYSNEFLTNQDETLNGAGQAVGNSLRYNGGSTQLGRSVWLYDGATTIDIGLSGPEHTRNDGYKYSDVEDLNEAGQAIGYSERYNGSTLWGQDAWLYNPVLGQTIVLQLSTLSDGGAHSSAAYLGEDGLVLGTYTLFDALDNNLGSRVFYFRIADGMHDLGLSVEGGLAANGWDYLASAIRANGLGQILGHGDLTSQSGGQMAYLMTPVPEPSTFVLAAVPALLLVLHGLRRRPWRSRGFGAVQPVQR